MSISYHVVGYIPADVNWNKMKNVYNTCKDAGVPIPAEVLKFFDDNDPNTTPGLEVDIIHAVTERAYEGSQVWEVDLNNLPRNDIRYIRFVLGY